MLTFAEKSKATQQNNSANSKKNHNDPSVNYATQGGLASLIVSKASNTLILRKPEIFLQQQLLKGDPDKLKSLFDAVKNASVGKKFINLAGGEPNLVWGSTGGFHASFDGENTITLNQKEKNKLNDCQWQQVIAMELGNFSNAKQINDIFGKGEEGELSKVEFVQTIEKIEFDSRDMVIKAYSDGEFGTPGPACPLIFEGGRMSFEDYIKDKRGVDHRAKYEMWWEKNCKKAYMKKHPGK